MTQPEIILKAIIELSAASCPTCGHDISPENYLGLKEVKGWLKKIVICRVKCNVYDCYHRTPHVREDYCSNGCFDGKCKSIIEEK